jgi:hypothetical protein
MINRSASRAPSGMPIDAGEASALYLTLFWSSMPASSPVVAAGWAGQLIGYAGGLNLCRSRNAARLSLRRCGIDKLPATGEAGSGVLAWVSRSPSAADSNPFSRATSPTGRWKVPTQWSSCHRLSTTRSCSGCQLTRKATPRSSMKRSRRVSSPRTFPTAPAWTVAGPKTRPAVGCASTCGRCSGPTRWPGSMRGRCGPGWPSRRPMVSAKRPGPRPTGCWPASWAPKSAAGRRRAHPGHRQRRPHSRLVGSN